MTFPTFSRKTRVNFGIGDLRSGHRSSADHEGPNQGRSLFDNKSFNERAGVEVVHRRSSRMVFEVGGPVTLARDILFNGFRVGSVRRPRAANWASRASRLTARAPA